jgi:hypothetical protein
MSTVDDNIVRAAGYLAAANNLLAQRFNYALVAHSMALAAYSTSAGEKGDTFVQIAVAVFGIFYAGIQWQITEPLTKRIDAIRDEWLLQDPVYLTYNTAAGSTRIRGLQSRVVPSALAVLWAALLYHAVAHSLGWPLG